MTKKYQSHKSTPGEFGWTLDRWREPAVVPPTRGMLGRGCPIGSFLATAADGDPLFQMWTQHCLGMLASVRCTEDPGRGAILQTAACLQMLHHGAHLYRTRKRPSASGVTLGDTAFRDFLARPVFLRFPSRTGTEAVALHSFEQGDQYVVEFDGTTRFQIITDRAVVLGALLVPDSEVVAFDMAPGELRWALGDDALAPQELRDRPGSLAAVRSLASTFAPA